MYAVPVSASNFQGGERRRSTFFTQQLNGMHGAVAVALAVAEGGFCCSDVKCLDSNAKT